MPTQSTSTKELSLLEMLADPIILTEMARDGATSSDLVRLESIAAVSPNNQRLPDQR